MKDNSMIVPCPNCKKSVLWSQENPFRPFCCERCKLIDLGEWADENKRIPGQPVIDPDQFDEYQ